LASFDQLERKLATVMSQRVATVGVEPPRLVRANSAFAKTSEE